MFLVFISDLLEEIHRAQIGIQLKSGNKVGGLLFADDFAGITKSSENLQQLIDSPLIGQVIEFLVQARELIQDEEGDINRLELVQKLREKIQLIHSKDEEKHSFSEQNRSLREKVRSFSEQNRSLGEQNRSLGEQVRTFSEENRSFSYQIRSIGEQNLSLLEKNRYFSSQIQSMAQSVAEKDAEIRQLHRSLQSQQGSLHDREERMSTGKEYLQTLPKTVIEGYQEEKRQSQVEMDE